MRGPTKKSDDYADIGELVLTLPHHSRARKWSLAGFTLFMSMCLVAPFLSSHSGRSSMQRCHTPGFHHDAAPGSALQLPRYQGRQVEYPDRFTLILNSYKRPLLLQKAVAHYAQCKSIASIRAAWYDDSPLPTAEEQPEFYSEDKPVRYDVLPDSSLNSRFWPLKGIETEAVLNLDDDIVAPCDVLDELFKVWRDNKRQLVGFYPRLVVHDSQCKYKYLLGFDTLTRNGRYSIILTKAAMMHRDYLEHYTYHMPARIREHIKQVHNCEDIAMQLLVTNATGTAPVFVHSSRVLDLGKGLTKVVGISSGKHHEETRSECLNIFARLYGGALPLVTRSVGEHHGPALALRLSPFLDSVYSIMTGHF